MRPLIEVSVYLWCTVGVLAFLGAFAVCNRLASAVETWWRQRAFRRDLRRYETTRRAAVRWQRLL